jgi:putative FmdB family regulatory protein
MRLYEYRCADCGNEFEMMMRFSEAGLPSGVPCRLHAGRIALRRHEAALLPGLRESQDTEEIVCGGVFRIGSLGLWRKQLCPSRRVFLSRLIHCSRELHMDSGRVSFSMKKVMVQWSTNWIRSP